MFLASSGCLWGTDWTRAVNLITYEQGVEPFCLTDRISESDKASLMGESLAKVYKWKPARGYSLTYCQPARGSPNLQDNGIYRRPF